MIKAASEGPGRQFSGPAGFPALSLPRRPGNSFSAPSGPTGNTWSFCADRACRVSSSCSTHSPSTHWATDQKVSFCSERQQQTMADDDKTATVREMKARFDENNAKLRNVRRLGCGAGGRTGRPWRAVLPCSGTGCKLQLCEGSHHHQRMRSAACAAAHVPPTRPPACLLFSWSRSGGRARAACGGQRSQQRSWTRCRTMWPRTGRWGKRECPCHASARPDRPGWESCCSAGAALGSRAVRWYLGRWASCRPGRMW